MVNLGLPGTSRLARKPGRLAYVRNASRFTQPWTNPGVKPGSTLGTGKARLEDNCRWVFGTTSHA
jgi:hypothetical protein